MILVQCLVVHVIPIIPQRRVCDPNTARSHLNKRGEPDRAPTERGRTPKAKQIGRRSLVTTRSLFALRVRVYVHYLLYVVCMSVRVLVDIVH